jgi:hypothetical protein
MPRDRHIKLLLVLIAALLAANLVVNLKMPIVHAEQADKATTAQILHFKSGSAGVALTCSSDGKIVYAADDEDVYWSLSFGAPGSWEHVLQ